MNTDPTILKQCADKGAEAASSLIDSSYLTVRDDQRDFEEEEPARIAFAKAAIEHYLKLNPVWVSTRDRLPTKEDEDKGGDVAVFSKEHGFSYQSAEDVKDSPIRLLWCSIKSIPAQPDPERDKFERWYEKQPQSMPETKEQLFQLWKSAKES